jgi:hypothetical protein
MASQCNLDKHLEDLNDTGFQTPSTLPASLYRATLEISSPKTSIVDRLVPKATLSRSLEHGKLEGRGPYLSLLLGFSNSLLD